ncbi:MAG: family 43 glycosylhydrolase [Clostridia bacterium]|nr:family 43 glycosylhydrolase [Clostridia bacterium]
MKSILISVSTKPVDPALYPAGLAQAVHISYQRPGEAPQPLNRDYGILFARGAVSAEDTIVPVGVCNPSIFAMADGWISIQGKMVDEIGKATGGAFRWKTRDLIYFEEVGPIDGADTASCSASLPVHPEIAEAAIRYWSPIRQESVSVPSEITARSKVDLDRVRAFVTYSDGSQAVKQIEWNTVNIDFSAPGAYEINGMIRRQAFRFPLARGYGDPVVFPWEGKWYFVATNDNLNDIGLYAREADSAEGLFAPGIEEHLILPFDPERGFEQTFWAPEFHVIGGEAYILFAVSGHAWGPQCHVMRLKKGGRPIWAEDWADPIPVLRKDGSRLSTDGITLDMTYIKAASGSYMVWSYRRHIGTPRDTGSMLYIASIDEKEPWRLTSEPVLLTRPLYGWENVAGTINNEGPHALIRDGKVYLTYSGGSANAYTYALGLLTANGADNLLNPAAWKKSITPVLTFRSVAGEYGPGHNSFFVNDQGETMIAYHAETDIREHLRCDGIRRVHFRADGTPYFQMSTEEDLPEDQRKVRIRVTVTSRK